MWNTFPGVLVARPQFSMDPKDFPFYNNKLGVTEDKFTAVIHTTTSTVKESSALSRLIKNAAQSKFISKVKINKLHCIIISTLCVGHCQTVPILLHGWSCNNLFKLLLPYNKMKLFHSHYLVSVSRDVHFRKIANVALTCGCSHDHIIL